MLSLIAPAPAVAGEEDRGRVAVVAHNAGIELANLDSALVAAADVIEIDVLRDGDHLIAAHPLTFPRSSVPLEEAWSAARPLGIIELDLKSTDTETLRLLVVFLRAHAGEGDVLVSSRDPRALRALRLHTPVVCRYQSVANRPALDTLLAEPNPAALRDGVMVAHRLLDEATIAALHAAGLTVVAWTVNDPERAAELVAWGVDGLTTDSAVIAETQGGGNTAPLACPRDT